MSHSSGIPVSAGLKDSFGSSVSSRDKRIIKVQIENDELVEVNSAPISGSWEDDIAVIPSLLEQDKPAFILFRLDTDTPQYTLFCYVPDKAKVKEKMLYASTRSNLKQQLGLSYFTDEVFGTVLADFSKDGYKHHMNSKKSDAPLTEQEQTKKNELESGPIYTGGQTTYVHGVSFPVEQQANDAINNLIQGKHNYVQIAIDCDNEKVTLDHAGNVDVSGLAGEIPTDQPRFHFYAWAHDHEGAEVTSIIFIYSSPDGSSGTKSAPVRQRMMYSSSKASVGEIVKALGGTVDGRLEINTPDDIAEEAFRTLIHPQKEEKKAAFNKPSRPGKGGRTLIKK
eukprot:TRINITY_DN284_c0_g1_i1.p1 TRINITY_DN284_c0_g1~~TRINITY_DN284_c0_g1_i1.p1  ORF type:complete len:338 (+),score=94.82 TRINITY_DN284_c0_g1_i1:40-1053(+)